MNAPSLLLAGPIVLAAILFPMRRWPQVASAAGAAAAWLLALMVAGLNLQTPAGNGGLFGGDSWMLYGRVFTLTEQLQILMVMVYALLGVMFLLSTFYPQSSIFVPVSLAVLSPLSGALMVSPSVTGAVLLLIAGGGLAVLMQGGRAGSTLAALRYLILSALATPMVLVAGWMLETDRFQFLDSATLLILAATLLLTASFPFQIWVAPAVRESSSLTPAVVYGIGQLLVVVFFLTMFADEPFVYGNAQFQMLVRGSAAATLILAGLLAITARSFGNLLGYLLLLSIGAVGASLGSGGRAVVTITLTLLLLRTISLILAGAGLVMIRQQARQAEGGANQFSVNRGLAWRTPLGIGLFVFGCLSLAGLPLTPGFAGTWPAVMQIGQDSPGLAVLLVMAIAAGAFGVLRHLVPLFGRPDQEWDEESEPQRPAVRIVSAVLLAAGVILAIFPQILLTFGERIANLL